MIGYVMYKGHAEHHVEARCPQSRARSDGDIGILPDILNTLYIVAGDACRRATARRGCGDIPHRIREEARRIVAAVEYAAETLSGIPSIIYGLVGMLFFCQFFGMKTSLMAGALTLVIMNLPDRDAHDPGEPEDRAAELPRGRFRTRRRASGA